MHNNTFSRNDCGAFIYPNGFKFHLEDTGSIFEACRDFHGGQGCPLYKLQSSMEATPSLVCEASNELEQAYSQWAGDFGEDAEEEDHTTYSQAVEDLATWAAGVQDLIETD
jgi:hypothetical protein